MLSRALQLVLVAQVVLWASLALCGERKDPFDEYIYHAPRLDGIVCDGEPSDWPGWLRWEAIEFKEPKGSTGWHVESGGWNYPPDGPDDFSVRFKAGWGVAESWPVLYLLLEWIDDEYLFDPEGLWNTTDALEFWYGESLYDYDRPLPQSEGWGFLGLDEDYAIRWMKVLLSEGWGIRMRKSEGYVVDEGQPRTKVASQRANETKVYIECQVQMFQSYAAGTPWQVEPGASCLAFRFAAVCDYDPSDGSFTYMPWGLFRRSDAEQDIRIAFSTIAFEPADYYAGAGSSSWGTIKATF